MADKADKKPQAPKENGPINQVAERIRTSDHVLVALSKDPSVDELSAALGLTFILDKMGKHATAIFSGAVPNAIEFLEPEKTFETNTNSLQDFIIALDKEKADHLRYKIDGDFVKVYITPYKTTLDESDVEFSHGDFNVDLVIALNVPGAAELDSALSEYGRIMHDASSINIKAAPAGNFADLEWGNPDASSVSEMIYKLSEKLTEDDKKLVDKPVATALLAGIVAATNRFSNEHTFPETLSVASKLMSAGADQQLISSSIPVDILTSDVVDANKDAEETKKKAPKTEIVETIPRGEAVDKKPEETPQPEAGQNPEGEQKPEGEQPADQPAPQEGGENQPAPEQPTEQPAEQPTEEKPAEEEKVKPEDDPTNLEIRHGAVDFNPDEEEDTPAEETPEENTENTENAEAPAEQPIAAPVAAPAPMPAVPAAYPQIVPQAAPGEQMAPPLPQPPIIPAVPPAAPVTPESVIIAPEVTAEQVKQETHVAEPLSEEDLNPDDHAAENAIDAALQKAAEAARQQNEAAAQLNQMIAANAPAAVNPTLQELSQQPQSGIKNITPPSEAMMPPKVPKDYASMMNEVLAEPAPAPVSSPIESAPVMAPQPQLLPPQMPQQMVPQMPQQMPPQMPQMSQMPQQAQSMPQAPQPMPQQMPPQMPQPQMPVPQAEYVSPLPMPDPNGLLPPPPAPFQPEAAMPASPAELPTAQAFAQSVQASNPAVQAAPQMMAQPVAPEAMPVPADMAPVAPIMPAVPEDPVELSNGGAAVSSAVNGVNPVMQDQIYPDPSAFQIPGM